MFSAVLSFLFVCIVSNIVTLHCKAAATSAGFKKALSDQKLFWDFALSRQEPETKKEHFSARGLMLHLHP
jgi:hypothetical protein